MFWMGTFKGFWIRISDGAWAKDSREAMPGKTGGAVRGAAPRTIAAANGRWTRFATMAVGCLETKWESES